MLIESKHWEQDLNLHDNQLLRYFNVSTAKFGLLTNGIIYRFYTDLVTPNKMDEKPFFGGGSLFSVIAGKLLSVLRASEARPAIQRGAEGQELN
jgi:hypothetical protein